MRYLFFLSFPMEGVGGGCWEKNNKAQNIPLVSHRKLVLLSCSPDCSMMVPASNHSTCSCSLVRGMLVHHGAEGAGCGGSREGLEARVRVRVRWSVRPLIRHIPRPCCTEDTVHLAQLKTVCLFLYIPIKEVHN